MPKTSSSRLARRPSYGIDAPGLVKGFFVGGAVALVVAVAAGLSPWRAGHVAGVVATLSGLASIYMFSMGLYMLYGSLVGKLRERHRLLDLVPWLGTELVLDVGCGRGLLLVAAARRAASGHATGIDLWQAEDQSGNSPDAALANARVEGVLERVDVQTGDARNLPFPDGAFDVVVSHWVIHNLYDPADRTKALAEMARVLKPGGWVLLADIGHHAEYVRKFEELGFANVRHVVSRFWDTVRTAITFGSFRPGTVVGQRV